jgi:predicted transcriptional regulator
MTTTMGIKLDNETRQRSAHWLMREAIREYLDREEQVERRNAEADEAWAEYRRTGQSVSNEAMTAWLDTWGMDKEGPCLNLEPRR